VSPSLPPEINELVSESPDQNTILLEMSHFVLQLGGFFHVSQNCITRFKADFLLMASQDWLGFAPHV
jgi:hypothetical protein